jgi:hypothetical protein
MACAGRAASNQLFQCAASVVLNACIQLMRLHRRRDHFKSSKRGGFGLNALVA